MLRTIVLVCALAAPAAAATPDLKNYDLALTDGHTSLAGHIQLIDGRTTKLNWTLTRDGQYLDSYTDIGHSGASGLIYSGDDLFLNQTTGHIGMSVPFFGPSSPPDILLDIAPYHAGNVWQLRVEAGTHVFTSGRTTVFYVSPTDAAPTSPYVIGYAAVPEPGTMGLATLGAVLLLILPARRRQRKGTLAATAFWHFVRWRPRPRPKGLAGSRVEQHSRTAGHAPNRARRCTI